MRPWKNHIVILDLVLLGVSSSIFLLTAYTALYWSWVRGNLEAALPYLPWARNFGMLAMISSAAALGILFSSRTFTISLNIRLWLSVLATATIGFYAEFRNEGKFHFKELVHFFGPETWIYSKLNDVHSSLGSFLYRIEYSHWNDFLMGPAIVSVLFALVSFKIYGAFRNQGSTSLRASASDTSTDIDDALRFARILMNVGLFWFFIQAWAEKASYWRNPHSNDEIDLPFEFAGTMLGFWMARVLTRPFDGRREKFRSNLVIDFVCSGLIGLLYTLIVGPLTEGVTSAVAHGLYPVVPPALNAHEYTPLQQHVRPLELLLLAGAMWWGLNRSSKNEELTRLSGSYEESEAVQPRWEVLINIAKAFGVTIGYLLVLYTMLSLAEPQGLGWTLVTATTAVGAGTAALFVFKRTAR